MLSVADTKFYLDNGYLLLKGLYDGKTVEEMRRETDAIMERVHRFQKNPNQTWGGNWLTPEQRQELVMHSTHDAQFHSATFTRALLNERLVDSVASVIGPNVQLHHTKFIIKPPEHGAPFPLHQDYPYFPHARHTMLAVTVHMDMATEESGCLYVVPGSHKLGPLPTQSDGLYLDPKEWPYEKAIPCEAEPGDGLMFNYLTIHGSKPNRSNHPRRNWLIQMRAPDDPPTKATHLSRGQGMMLRGFDPLTQEVAKLAP